MRERALRSSAVEIGKLVMAWTDLHTALSMLFSFVMDQSGFGVAQSVWHSTTSDRTQRGMLTAALSHFEGPRAIKAKKRRPHVTDELVDAADWLLKETNKLADQRNLVIHSGYWLFAETETLRPVFNPLSGPRALKSWSTKLPDHIRYLRLKTEALARYANKVSGHVMDKTVQTPWPDRPLLPTVGQTTRNRDSGRRLQKRKVEA